MSDRGEWYDNPDTVHSVATYGVDESKISGVDELLYFFEKPWKWQQLHDEWALWGHMADKANR